MNPNQLFKKRLMFIVLVAYFVIGYFTCGHFNLNRAHYFDVSLPFEANIPLIPFFVVGYSSVYFGLILIYILVDDYSLFKKTVAFFVTVVTVHLVIFLLLPVKMARPDIANAGGMMTRLTYYYYLIDNPVNCFPSLHVSYPFAGTIILWNYKRRWAYLMAALTLFIAISVVLVKQHYIMDIVGAIFTTSMVYVIFSALKRCSKLQNE